MGCCSLDHPTGHSTFAGDALPLLAEGPIIWRMDAFDADTYSSQFIVSRLSRHALHCMSSRSAATTVLKLPLCLVPSFFFGRMDYSWIVLCSYIVSTA